jgi:hypothetical protein
MRVSVQDNIDIVRRLRRRNMVEAEFQPTARKIDNQRPVKIAVAIAAHHGDSGPDRAKLVENAFRAHIAEVPDFIGISCHLVYFLRQTIVRVRQDKDL